jgi:ribosomal protein S18 acetylase RimI-like enzyme
MNIRPLCDGDMDAVVALWERCGLLRPWNDPYADIGLARRTASAAVFVGTDNTDGTLIATVMCGHDGHRGWMYYVAVDPGHRYQGHGRAMIAAAENWLRDLGVRKVELMIRNTNKAVSQFYHSLDYREEPVITMSRWLVEPVATPDG